MFVDHNGQTTEIDDFPDLGEVTEQDGASETLDGGVVAIKEKARGTGKKKVVRSTGQGDQGTPAWVKLGLEYEVWRDRVARGTCMNCGNYGHTSRTCRGKKFLTRVAAPTVVGLSSNSGGASASTSQGNTSRQTLDEGEERRLRAERRARALAAGLQEANRVARERATAARAAAMANGTSSAASSSASSSGTSGPQLRMPLNSTSGTFGSTGSRQSSSQMAGSQFSPLTPSKRELREIQQVERLHQQLEEDLKKATDREKEIKSRAARLDTLEADKAALEGLDESSLSDTLKVLRDNLLSLHAHVDSRMDFMQNTLDQILDALTKPGFQPPAQSPLPLTAM
ncbi:hypothetical protein CBR_g37497 [Chara braunii]|uniref:CCHC-type domain-containing protein n=1 Tax=Chara braunii TaxID=69332 RepID=A0A388LMX7_CHABU|nr:hypothetical protein CBR_g37497 [Chara braunii]|eukprot:GBG83696.1 hypothetical protein CBR_g37497 [Chara braunii]